MMGNSDSDGQKKRGLWWKIPLILLGLLLVVGGLLHAPLGSTGIEVSRETTYITSPLGPDGMPDYLAYVNAQNARGVTDANDATPGLLRVIGMGALPPEVAEKILEYKGLSPGDVGVGLFVPWEDRADKGPLPDANAPQPPAPGDASPGDLLDPNTLGRWIDPLEELDFYDVHEQLADGNVHPQLEPWLAENAAALALLSETARERSRLHLPLLTAHEGAMVIAYELPATSTLRDLGRALGARARVRMLRGDADGAWADVLTIHRYSRLIYQQQSLVEKLVAIACEARAFEVARELIAREAFGQGGASRRLEQLTEIGPPSKIDEAFVLERLWVLDAFINLSQDPSQIKDYMPKRLGPLASGAMDWNVALRLTNEVYDAMPLPRQSGGPRSTQAARARWDRLCEGLRGPAWSVSERARFALLLVGGVATRQARSEYIARRMLSLFVPSLGRACGIQDETVMGYRLERVALAVAACKARTGRTPAALSDLTPTDLQTVPDDLFQGPTGGPLTYRTTAEGYVLYSVGGDGDDDGGARWDRQSDDGDIVIRVPGEE